MPVSKSHIARIKKELRDAGMTRFGMLKFASNHLPTVIQDDEHIKAVVYGRYNGGKGILRYSEGMLVATTNRIIFLDHKPGYTTMDELSYDMVVGIKKSKAGPFSSLTIHTFTGNYALQTRIGNYTISFANARCTDMFADYVGRRLEKLDKDTADPASVQGPALDNDARTFLHEHDIAVLSTVDRTGNVSGAAVYYAIGADDQIYVLTKSGTQKMHNILAHHQVALTVFDAATAQTVQLQGTGEIEPDQATKNRIFTEMTKLRTYDGARQFPPVTALHDGSYMILRILPTVAHFSDYKQ